MKVIAIKEGFYGGSVRPVGSQFDVDEKAKASWFAPVGDVKAPKAEAEAKSKGKSKDEPKALSQLAPGGKSFTDVHAGKADGDLA